MWNSSVVYIQGCYLQYVPSLFKNRWKDYSKTSKSVPVWVCWVLQPHFLLMERQRQEDVSLKTYGCANIFCLPGHIFPTVRSCRALPGVCCCPLSVILWVHAVSHTNILLAMSMLNIKKALVCLIQLSSSKRAVRAVTTAFCKWIDDKSSWKTQLQY